MSLELLSALVAFSIATSITPGPNNLMLMASGANYGLRRSAPHLSGVFVGFLVMVVLVGVGVMRLFDAFPVSLKILTVLSVAYLLYMAYRIATAAPSTASEAPKTGRPMTFLEAALFQWVNPKGWSMAVTAITVYAPSRGIDAVLMVAAVLGAVGLPCLGVWIAMGTKLSSFLNTDQRLKYFNWLMATLLVASVVPVVMG